MTKEEEREQLILENAEILKEGLKGEFWRIIKDYIVILIQSDKNRLTRIDLDTKRLEAAKIQGKIERAYSIFNRIENVIKEAEMIEKRNKKKKEK